MDHDKAARRALLVAKALKHHASVIHNPASIMGNPPPPVARYGMVSPHLTQIAPVARAAGGSADPAFTDADATAQMKYIQDPNIAMPANQVDQEIDGGGYADGGDVNKALNVVGRQQADPVALAKQTLSAPRPAPVKVKKGKNRPVKYQSWDDVPTIDPQDLVGKKLFPIFADLTKAGSAFSGVDSSKLKNPEQLYGGPGYPLLPEAQQHGLGWAVEGKGRGTSKLLKDADYIVVSAMEPYSHQSNASFSNSLMKNMDAYVQDKRLAPDAVNEINNMIRRPTAQKELQGLENFPGFDHPDAEQFLRGMTFEQRKRVASVLASKEAQELGAPNIDKITRATLDPNFAGVPSRHGMFLLKVPKTKEGLADEDRLKELLVHLKDSGLPEHPSYQYGIKGDIVGKFHNSVSPEILFKDWFDKKRAEESAAREDAEAKGLPALKTNTRRAFDLAMPVVTVSQEVADMLPRHPSKIQSGKAAQLALNAFNDQWHSTDTPVSQGGMSPADLAQALKNSDYSSTLDQYTPRELASLIKEGKFSGYKLKDGEIYFGLKKGTDYAQKYGFSHPDLTPNETALTGMVNNEPGAKGMGGAPVVLKAIQHGATALDAFAVPSKAHPDGYLPGFYSHFGFEELGRVPFDPESVTTHQLEDMKHQWRMSGWDESQGLPQRAIMKWRGSDADRQDAARRFVSQGSQDAGEGRSGSDVRRASRSLEQGAGQAAPQTEVGGSDQPGGNRGAVRTDRPVSSPDRFSRTLGALKGLPEPDLRHYGVDPSQASSLKEGNFARGAIPLHPALNIPGVHIRTAEAGEPIFHGDK